jgi:hypothetical protein
MTLSRTIQISDITPAELAMLFTDMDDHHQAAFFAAIKPITDKWDGAGWCQQSCSIIQQLDDAGLSVVRTLASHLPTNVLAGLAEEAA